MQHHMKPMACGGCGHGSFTAHTDNKYQRIVLECEKCKSTSEIVPSGLPRLDIVWGAGASGILTEMKPTS